MDVRFFGGGALPGTTRQFKDTFQRANSTNIGTRYAYSLLFSGSTGVNVLPQILTNKLRLTCGAATSRALIYPAPLTWIGQQPTTHFSELTIAAQGNTSWDMELSCVMSLNPSAGTPLGYYCAIINPAGAPGAMFTIEKAIYSGNSGAQPTFTNLSAALGTWSLGDVIRFSASISGTTWTLTLKQNGTQIAQVTDTSLVAGVPGMIPALTGPAVTLDISEFACGTGL